MPTITRGTSGSPLASPNHLTAHTQIADAIESAAYAYFVGCSLTKSARQTITESTDTALTFDQEDYDTDGLHSISSNTSRITIPAGFGGKWLVGYTVQWYTDSVSGNRRSVIRKNGNSALEYGAVQHPTVANSGHGVTYQSASAVVTLADSDYVELFVWEYAGGANVDVDIAETRFWAYRLTGGATLAGTQVTVEKTADESVVASTTLQDDDHLKFDVAANGVYWFDLWLKWTQTTGTTNMKAHWTVPSGTTMAWDYSMPAGARSPALSESSTDTIGVNQTTVQDVHYYGWVTAGGTPGTVQLQWAQSTAAGTLTVQKGSYLRFERVDINSTASGSLSLMQSDKIWDAKGDLAVGTGPDTAVRLPVGSNGQSVVADSAQTSGVKWGGWIEIVKSADQTVTNNGTPQNDSEFTFSLDGSSGYVIEFWVLYDGNNATGDYKANFHFSAGVAAVGYWYGVSTTEAMLASNDWVNGTDWPNTAISLGVNPGFPRPFFGQLNIMNNNAGSSTFTYQFCNASAASGRDSTTKAKSTLRYRKLA